MATRPIFVPHADKDHLVEEVVIDFRWHPGMAPSQKKKNVDELHAAAEQYGLWPLLEISSKSNEIVGQKLSAFNLVIDFEGQALPLENAFQGSKVFVDGGPYQDLYGAKPGEARRDPRIRNSGKIIGFKLGKTTYPSEPPTGFYDWLYVRALRPHAEWLQRRTAPYVGYTDIEFNPERSLNCQARAFALLVSLLKRGDVTNIADDYWSFTSLFHKGRYWTVSGPATSRPMI
jgi:hypothetical protein